MLMLPRAYLVRVLSRRRTNLPTTDSLLKCECHINYAVLLSLHSSRYLVLYDDLADWLAAVAATRLRLESLICRTCDATRTEDSGDSDWDLTLAIDFERVACIRRLKA